MTFFQPNSRNSDRQDIPGGKHSLGYNFPEGTGGKNSQEKFENETVLTRRRALQEIKGCLVMFCS